MEISSCQRQFQPSRVSFCIDLNSKDPSPIYKSTAVRVFILLFSFSIFSDCWSLKIENENNNTKI